MYKDFFGAESGSLWHAGWPFTKIPNMRQLHQVVWQRCNAGFIIWDDWNSFWHPFDNLLTFLLPECRCIVEICLRYSGIVHSDGWMMTGSKPTSQRVSHDKLDCRWTGLFNKVGSAMSEGIHLRYPHHELIFATKHYSIEWSLLTQPQYKYIGQHEVSKLLSAVGTTQLGNKSY